jgi:PIN domain nuclease of toxin-antitoxin system
MTKDGHQRNTFVRVDDAMQKPNRHISILMGDQHPNTKSVVFDTEPIIRWIEGGSGAQTVARYLSDTYYRNIETAISHVHLTEVFYVCADYQTPQYATKKTTELQNMGVTVVNTNTVWETAGHLKHKYTPDFPLGDAFALATASERGVPLLTGDDSHWDDPLADEHDILTIP